MLCFMGFISLPALTKAGMFCQTRNSTRVGIVAQKMWSFNKVFRDFFALLPEALLHTFIPSRDERGHKEVWKLSIKQGI